MTKKYIGILIVIAAVLAIICGYRAYLSGRNATVDTTTPSETIQSSTYPTGVASNADPLETAEITDLIVAFGDKLQSVPLAASKNIAAAAIEENYGGYVSTDLLTRWKNNPSNAPGRKTSSPWPDHITIDSITKNIADNGQVSFVVKSTVVELTSVEVAQGGIADSYPITLTVQNKNGVWLITGTNF